MTKVRMIHSIGDYIAGEEVELDDEQADRFVVLGYAEGELTRDYDEQEQQAIHANAARQEVSV